MYGRCWHGLECVAATQEWVCVSLLRKVAGHSASWWAAPMAGFVDEAASLQLAVCHLVLLQLRPAFSSHSRGCLSRDTASPLFKWVMIVGSGIEGRVEDVDSVVGDQLVCCVEIQNHKEPDLIPTVRFSHEQYRSIIQLDRQSFADVCYSTPRRIVCSRPLKVCPTIQDAFQKPTPYPVTDR